MNRAAFAPGAPLHALTNYRQFIVYRLVQRAGGKPDKLPIDYRTGEMPPKGSGGPLNPAIHTDFTTAADAAERYGRGYGVGFVFTDNDPFWFLDLDAAVANGVPTPLAFSILSQLPDCAVETSVSGTGLHVFGTGLIPPHTCRGDNGLELYHRARFVALTGADARGDASTDATPGLWTVAAQYFPVDPDASPEGDNWHEGPMPGHNPPQDDDTLIAWLRNRPGSAAQAFGHEPTFADLWDCDVDALTKKVPPREAHQSFDHTRADAILAELLVYGTAGDCPRVVALMGRSELANRPKWREDKAVRAVKLGMRGKASFAFEAPAAAVQVPAPPVPEGTVPVPPPSGPAVPDASHFYAYLPSHDYIHRPTGMHWPAASLDSTIGRDMRLALDVTSPIHMLSWAPGLPERFQLRDLDESNHRAAQAWVYNQYHAPAPGAPGDPQPWLDLLQRLYPQDAAHILRYFADAVQNPGRKCNHALVLGSGAHGIGKDTLLKPLRRAVGERNYAIIEPKDLFADFNPWAASVVVQISESRNVGDGDGGRISKYDIENKVKNLAAAPPATLQCNVKHVSQFQVRNCCRLIITTNHGVDGIYIDAEDRRHYCAWSTAPQMIGSEAAAFHAWLDAGGSDAVAHYLASFDLAGWNHGAPPPKTEWWHRLVLEGNPQDDNPLQDAIERIGSPPWITAEGLAKNGSPELTAWFADSRNRRAIPRHFARLGYARLRNPAEKRGRFFVQGQQRVVYARPEITPADVADQGR